VTVGLAVAGRHPKSDVLGYVVAQVLGAIAGAALIDLMATGREGWEAGSSAANGFGDLSPTGAPLLACLICEVVMTFFFLLVIIRLPSKDATPA